MKKFCLTFFVYACSLAAWSQQTSEQFNFPIDYLLYLPKGYHSDTAQKWPLMIFLHGSGESGSDIEKVKVHGPPKLIEQGKQFPCIVVSPQRGPSMRGWETDLMIKLIQSIKGKYRVDPTRVYLTGLSMGGYGTWNIAMRYPREFAAIAPICGGGEIERIGQLRNTPVWCFHGAKDNVVKLKESSRLIDTLKKFNPRVKFTVYPEAGHDSWTETYNNDSFYTWLFAQRQTVHTNIVLPAEKLKEYTGKYAQRGKDTAELVVDGEKLKVKEHAKIVLIPFERDKFYIKEGDVEVEIEFVRDRKGNVERFIFHDENEQVFYRVQ